MANQYTISGHTVDLIERPKHSAVMRVQGLITEWMMSKIDVTNLEPTLGIEDALQAAILKEPGMAQELSQLQQTMEIDQTILLASNMTIAQLTAIKTEAYEDEYIEFYDAAVDALGGSANSFFENYNINIRSRRRDKRVEVAVEKMKSASPSGTSDSPQSSSLLTSTEPSKEEISTISE